MVLFLRDERNRTIIETEIYNTSDSETKNDKKYLEIHSSVNIKEYSIHLITMFESDKNLAIEFIKEISNLSELRGWLLENYFSSKDNNGSDENYNEVLKIVSDRYKEVAQKFNFKYVED